MISKTRYNKENALKARELAKKIADDTQAFIDLNTTVSVERAVCRLLGIDGVNKYQVPLPNVVVDHLTQRGLIDLGAAYSIANACVHFNIISPLVLAKMVAKGQIDMAQAPRLTRQKAMEFLAQFVSAGMHKMNVSKRTRARFLRKYPDKPTPFLYVIVATGNIYEDIVQAKAAARQGADIIAVIRTTGQSLLDYVPYGATTEGFGGTYATQENFRLMRAALDEVSVSQGRYIRLCNYCSGLCMSEIAAIGAMERLDVMLNDALYGILFRDINMKRTLIDQYFSRLINAYTGVIINTGEDNYLTTADAYEAAHTVLASQFMNEQFALKAYLSPKQMGLGHAYEIDPKTENSFIYELAQARLARELFPKAPLKYMPPTRFMTGDVFTGHVQNTLFNAASVISGQRIHLLGMLTEALHTPFMSDRALSIINAEYVFNAMKDFGDEIIFKRDGKIVKRANEVLSKAVDLLQEIESLGLFKALSKGVFADIKRQENQGKGLDGVYKKSPDYLNPFLYCLTEELSAIHAGKGRPKRGGRVKKESKL